VSAHAVRFTRKERLAQIVELKAKGLTYRQIAERLGLTQSGVRNIVNDPDGSKQRARRKRYQGQCIDCGEPTDGASGRAKAPMRCKWCAQGLGRPMAARPRLRVPVRLTELPLHVRLDGVRDASRIERDPLERTAILLAALEPSDRTYWVSEAARPLIEGWTASERQEAA
jgi:Homeodomain-like domain